MPNMRQELPPCRTLSLWDPEGALGKSRRLNMRLTLLAGVAALSFVGIAAAQAETIYTTSDPAVVATPGQVVAVPAPPFGPFTPQYVVTQPSVVAAPPIAAPRERVIERERIVERPRSGPVRERVIERQRV